MTDRVKTRPKLDHTGLQEAAERAVENGDYETAVKLFSEAIEIVGLSDETCFQLLSGRARCFGRLSQIEAEMLDRKSLVELSERMGDQQLQTRALLDFAQVAGLHGFLPESLQSAKPSLGEDDRALGLIDKLGCALYLGGVPVEGWAVTG